MYDTETIQNLINQASNMIKEGEDIESILTFLREEINRKTVSIKVVSDLLEIPFGEAKKLVHNSQTWSDKKKVDEKVEQLFFDALNGLANE